MDRSLLLAQNALRRLAAEAPLTRRALLRGAIGLGALALAGPFAARAQMRTRFTGYPFTLGVASGYPRPDGVSLWTRLAPQPLAADGGMTVDEWVTVTWQVADDEGFSRIVREGRVRTVQELAHSVHVDVDGLAPDRPYFYRFIAQDDMSPVGRTRTAPAPGATPDRLRFAIASCQHYEQGWFTSYPHVVADQADLMVFLGDYIYESSWGDELVRRHATPEPYDLDGYRVRHAQYRTDPDLQAAHAAMPWLVTFDDHELDNDWSEAATEHLDPRFLLRRAAALQAYYEHMPLPRSMLPGIDGSLRIHTTVDFGQLARFVVLDERQYRTAPACPDPYKGGGSSYLDPAGCEALRDPARTLLGREQEAWLQQQLRGSTARWNILAQQTLMTPMDTKPGDGETLLTDTWDGYPLARQRVLAELGRKQLGNPVVVGGDIHATVVADLQQDPRAGSPVLGAEVCTTSLASQGWPQSTYDGYLRDNPHLKFGRSDRRGYCLLTLGKDCDVAIRAVATVKQPRSEVETLARFVVEDGVRGIRPA